MVDPLAVDSGTDTVASLRAVAEVMLVARELETGAAARLPVAPNEKAADGGEDPGTDDEGAVVEAGARENGLLLAVVTVADAGFGSRGGFVDGVTLVAPNEKAIGLEAATDGAFESFPPSLPLSWAGGPLPIIGPSAELVTAGSMGGERGASRMLLKREGADDWLEAVKDIGADGGGRKRIGATVISSSSSSSLTRGTFRLLGFTRPFTFRGWSCMLISHIRLHGEGPVLVAESLGGAGEDRGTSGRRSEMYGFAGVFLTPRSREGCFDHHG